MDSSMKIAVIGAGTMGSGIAQVAAQAGHKVVLFDTRKEAVDKALAGLRKTLDKLVGKGKFTAAQGDQIFSRIKPATDLNDLADSGLVIEAIIEDLGIKKKLFADLESVLTEDAILATNTSSLSVTAIAAACAKPERVIGLHFFNPAPVLPLVEVVPGLATDSALAPRMSALMRAWGKIPVMCKDTPGFIVNRVARPFYGEAIRIFEEGIADMPTIDAAMKSVGFKMGPFELMDLIGNDINFTVTKTVWEAFFFDPRYKPSLTQQRQVESGRLGRKTGRGYYSYDANGAIQTSARSPQTSAGSLVEDPAVKGETAAGSTLSFQTSAGSIAEDPAVKGAMAAGSLCASGDPAEVFQTSAGSLAEDPAVKGAMAAGSLRASGDPAEVYQATGSPPASGNPAEVLTSEIVERVLAMLMNEAADALFWQVAAAKDIDLAMTKGVNYPKGLLAWANEKGASHWLGVLERLQVKYGEERYRPSPLLRISASTGALLT